MRQLDIGETCICEGKYIGKTMCGFVHGNEYACRVAKNTYGYTVEQIDEFVDKPAVISYACVNSVNKSWDNFTEV